LEVSEGYEKMISKHGILSLTCLNNYKGCTKYLIH
jgi:hypothetical protein